MDHTDWNAKPVRELIRHIVRRHHGYLRAAMPELDGRMRRVFALYGDGGPDRALGRVFSNLWDELDLHLEKEETILFPYMERLEAARATGSGPPEVQPGWAENPLELMEDEHTSVVQAMETMRRLVGEDQGRDQYRGLVNGLQELETDLNIHIHLENDILFPRVRQMM